MRTFERTLVRNLLDENANKLIEHSFRDYHSKGLDYLCLHRTPDLTIKAYFINTPVSSNVVNPHNHAYDSTSFVLKGRVQNALFVRNPSGKRWFRYGYKTPLNGAESGFKFESKSRLLESDRTRTFGIGNQFELKRGDIHTLRPLTSEVVLIQFQYKNRASEGTHIYLEERKIPDTSNLYKPWQKQDFEKSIKSLHNLVEEE